MVKYSRDQSTEAPRRFIWSVMAEPYWLLPLPDALDEGFAAEVFAVGAFGGELALDHHLGGDAGVVGAGDPERGLAAHAVPAGEDVHLGLVEHVAHVQAAGDVGRREQDGEGLRVRRASSAGVGTSKRRSRTQYSAQRCSMMEGS